MEIRQLPDIDVGPHAGVKPLVDALKHHVDRLQPGERVRLLFDSGAFDRWDTIEEVQMYFRGPADRVPPDVFCMLRESPSTNSYCLDVLRLPPAPATKR